MFSVQEQFFSPPAATGRFVFPSGAVIPYVCLRWCGYSGLVVSISWG